VVVDLDDGVGPLRKDTADSFGSRPRLVAGCPAAEVAVDFDFGAREAGITGTGLGVVLLLPLSRDIDVSKHVVNHPAITGRYSIAEMYMSLGSDVGTTKHR